MSRNAKLYDRLEALRSEFLELLANELERVAQSCRTAYFYRHAGPVSEGRSWRGAREARMEELEEELTHLRKKLGADPSTCPTRYAREFLDAYEAAGSSWWHGQDKAVAKRLLGELQREIDTQQDRSSGV